MTDNKKYGFGIVGCGMISKWHASAVASIDEAYLAGACDSKFESAESFAKEHGCIAFES